MAHNDKSHYGAACSQGCMFMQQLGVGAKHDAMSAEYHLRQKEWSSLSQTKLYCAAQVWVIQHNHTLPQMGGIQEEEGKGTASTNSDWGGTLPTCAIWSDTIMAFKISPSVVRSETPNTHTHNCLWEQDGLSMSSQLSWGHEGVLAAWTGGSVLMLNTWLLRFWVAHSFCKTWKTETNWDHFVLSVTSTEMNGTHQWVPNAILICYSFGAIASSQ